MVVVVVAEEEWVFICEEAAITPTCVVVSIMFEGRVVDIFRTL